MTSPPTRLALLSVTLAFAQPALTQPAFAQPALTQPAFAQSPPPASDADSGGGDKVNMVIIYGADTCPRSTGDEITVCARKPESERYRIPAPFRTPDPSTANEPWTNKVTALGTVGATGTGSCSPVGPGGFTGCTAQLIHQAHEERKTWSDVQFSKMIDTERQKRLSHIDANSAAQQAQVEQAEKEYQARQRREADPDGGDTSTAAPAAPVAPAVAGPKP